MESTVDMDGDKEEVYGIHRKHRWGRKRGGVCNTKEEPEGFGLREQREQKRSVCSLPGLLCLPCL